MDQYSKVTFASYAGMQKAFASYMIAASVKAVVYDNEAWSFTPVQEQRQPGLYDQLAAELVHQYHLIFIAPPVTDVARLIAPTGGNIYHSLLRLDIAGAAARYADVYQIQAQD